MDDFLSGQSFLDAEAAERMNLSDDDLIAELALLPTLEYEKRRADAAKKLGCRASILDRIVRDAKPSASDSANAGNSVLFPEIQLHPDPVDGELLLDDMTAAIRRFVVLPKHADTALALWAVFSHVIEAVNVAPILCLSSPEKRCGKTTVLSVITQLAYRPLPAANISSAALFRSIEAWAPTLLIDEADTFIRESPELNGIINSGHTRPTAFVIRTVGDDFEPRRFSTWGAKSIALIGKLPETLHDRSIVIELRRKLPGEAAEKLRHAPRGLFTALQQRIARWAADHIDSIRSARPSLPDSLNDRAADNWEPLLAIASVVGGSWPDRALKAAQAMSGADADSRSLNQELLDDIRDVFDEKRVDRISTGQLIEALCSDDEKAWGTYNRGKPITPKQISKRLREFGVVSKSVRIGTGTPKGFERQQFDDAFSRYSSAGGHFAATTPQPAPAKGFSVADDPQQATPKTVPATAKPAPAKDCGGVAGKTHFSGDAEMRNGDDGRPGWAGNLEVF